jgi:biopolymer transport protein ExbD
MAWSVRHTGSPRAIKDLTAAQIIIGLREGLWEPADEVLGPDDRNWIPIESHPQFALAAAEIEAPPPREHPDETRLDMNPLIDVCLVLLIFFIMTARIIEHTTFVPLGMAQAAQNVNPAATRKVSRAQVKENMIWVKAYKNQKGQPLVEVEGHGAVGLEGLRPVLEAEVLKTKKHEMLLDITGVTWAEAVKIHDAAKAVGINQINYLTG